MVATWVSASDAAAAASVATLSVTATQAVPFQRLGVFAPPVVSIHRFCASRSAAAGAVFWTITLPLLPARSAAAWAADCAVATLPFVAVRLFDRLVIEDDCELIAPSAEVTRLSSAASAEAVAPRSPRSAVSCVTCALTAVISPSEAATRLLSALSADVVARPGTAAFSVVTSSATTARPASVTSIRVSSRWVASATTSRRPRSASRLRAIPSTASAWPAVSAARNVLTA